jgi:hypothetical protein
MLENEDLVNISMITDTGLDELTDENADNTTHLSWEEADQNDEQLQSAECVYERLESFSDADNHRTSHILKCMRWLNVIMTCII